MFFDGSITAAHRLSFMAFNGPIPPGMVVRHSCNQPSCINPGHLLIGTQRDNIHDAIRCGRFAFNPKILPEATAEAIRTAHAAGIGYGRISQMFGVSRSCARNYALSAHSPRSRQK
jgi:hypothetical protein